MLNWLRKFCFPKEIKTGEIVIPRESLPVTHEPDDDGFDRYRLAAAQLVYETGQIVIGEVDDDGNLILRTVEEK